MLKIEPNLKMSCDFFLALYDNAARIYRKSRIIAQFEDIDPSDYRQLLCAQPNISFLWCTRGSASDNLSLNSLNEALKAECQDYILVAYLAAQDIKTTHLMLILL